MPPQAATDWRIARICDYIATHLDEPLHLAQLAALLGIGETHFAHLFRAGMGVSCRQYCILVRMAEARRLLSDTALPLSEIAVAVGYTDQSVFTQRFRRQLGVMPKRYRDLWQPLREGGSDETYRTDCRRDHPDARRGGAGDLRDASVPAVMS